jgi:polygalacturonase
MSILSQVILFVAAWTIAGQSAYSQDHILNVQDHISTSGREVLLTNQLQELVDQCHENGGGTVYFPPGEYLTGTLFLKSGVYLELAPGATLYGSKDLGDYPHDGLKSLIYANGQHNLGIKGQGTVNG